DKRLLMIPPVDLDALMNFNLNSRSQGGNYLLTVPCVFYFFKDRKISDGALASAGLVYYTRISFDSILSILLRFSTQIETK
ncbi:MAG: hypothetical protein ABIH71_02820, partial [Candidatus Omnitrophota bacterium]